MTAPAPKVGWWKSLLVNQILPPIEALISKKFAEWEPKILALLSDKFEEWAPKLLEMLADKFDEAFPKLAKVVIVAIANALGKGTSEVVDKVTDMIPGQLDDKTIDPFVREVFGQLGNLFKPEP